MKSLKRKKKLTERDEVMKMFSDTAKLFGDICQDGVITLFGQEDGIVRITPERFKEMERLFKSFSEKGLI